MRAVAAVDERIKGIIEHMDDDTTLLVFGDHGISAKGDHGGITTEEVATIVFAYQKTPFPMAEVYRSNPDLFYDIDHSIKSIDIAADISLLLDHSTPFSNFGIAHPALAPYDDLPRLYKKLLENVEQITTYLDFYCEHHHRDWCRRRDYSGDLDNYRRFQSTDDAEMLSKIHDLR
jgi:phosphatidylinositol glycan class O